MAEFVGKDRQQAVERLRVSWETCRKEGSARLMVLLGNPGAGKTRVVREFYAALAATQPLPSFWPSRVTDESDKPLDGRGAIAPDTFDPPPRTTPAYAWVGVSCRLDQFRRPEDALIKAEQRLRHLHRPIAEGRGRLGRVSFAFFRLVLLVLSLAAIVLGYLGIETLLVVIVGALSFLAYLHIELTRESVPTLHREWYRTRRERSGARISDTEERRVLSRSAKDYVDGFLDELSKHHLPAVVVIDDATEADPDTLEMVESLLGRSQPVLVIATARPDPYQKQRSERNGFGALVPKWSRREVIELCPMATEDLSRLIRSIAPCTKEAVASAIAAHADGNPLILLAGLDAPVLRDHLVDGAYDVEDLPRVLEGLPRDYDAVFERYWDRLDEELKRVLALASFHGEVVQPKVLRAGCSVAIATDAEHHVDRARDPQRFLLVRFEEFLDRFSDAALFEQAARRRGSVVEPSVIDHARHKMVAEIVVVREDDLSWLGLGDAAHRVLLSFHIEAVNDGVCDVDREAARSAVELADLSDRPHEAARRAALADMALAWAGGDDEIVDAAWTVGAVGHHEAGNVSTALGLLQAQLDYRRRVRGERHPDTLETRRNLARALRDIGRLDEAIAAFENVLSDSRPLVSADDPDDTLSTRNGLAIALSRAGRLKEAITVCETVLAGRRGLLGEDHIDTLVTRNNLAITLRKAGRLDQAISALEALLADCRRLLGQDHRYTLVVRNNLGSALVDNGQLDEGIVALELVLGDRRRILGEDHPETLTSRNNIAEALCHAGRLDEAISAFEAMLPNYRRVLGDDHPNTLAVRTNLAGALLLDGRVKEAIANFEALLLDCRRVLGQDDPDTLAVHASLAGALLLDGRAKEAITACEALLPDCRRVLGVDHDDTLAAGITLASALREAGRVEDAIVAGETVLGGCRRVLGEDHPTTLAVHTGLAGALLLDGRFEEAITAYEALLPDCRRVLGEDHPTTLVVHTNLAGALFHAGRSGEAITACEVLVLDSRRVLGEDHPDTLTARTSLAAALREAGRVKEAIAACEALLLDCRRVLGEDHPTMLGARITLAAALREAGRVEDAIDAGETVVSDSRRVLGEDHPTTLAARTSLAATLRKTGRFEEAITACQALLPDCRRVLGKNHPTTLMVRNDLAKALSHLSD
jgi:tetratricopeptide (TPR) repeat protein